MGEEFSQMIGPGDIYNRFVESFPEPAEGNLVLWWIPQVPGEMFQWPVPCLKVASMLADALSAYDDFQFAQRIKGDYSNAGGLMVYRNGDWEDWESAGGDDFDTWRSHFARFPDPTLYKDTRER